MADLEMRLGRAILAFKGGGGGGGGGPFILPIFFSILFHNLQRNGTNTSTAQPRFPSELLKILVNSPENP